MSCSQVNNTTIHGTSTITYDGTPLPCTDVDTCDGLNAILAKFDAIICNIASDVATLTEDVTNITEDVMMITEDILNINNQLNICCPTTTTTTTVVPTTTTTTTVVPTTTTTSSSSTTTTTTSSSSTTTTTTTATPTTTTTSSSTSTTTSTSSTSTTTSTSTSSTTTTTTTEAYVLYEGLISDTSDFTNACLLPLTDTVWIEGDYVRVFTDSGGTTPFNGSNVYWHLQKLGDVNSASFPINASGFITGPASLCL